MQSSVINPFCKYQEPGKKNQETTCTKILLSFCFYHCHFKAPLNYLQRTIDRNCSVHFIGYASFCLNFQDANKLCILFHVKYKYTPQSTAHFPPPR